MSTDEMVVMWLRDRASGLRDAAARCERAYTAEVMAAKCGYAARHYRRAAALLDDAATAAEADATLLREAKR